MNSTGTLEEEKRDLETLNDLVKQYADRLAAVGMKPAFRSALRRLRPKRRGAATTDAGSTSDPGAGARSN